MIALEKFEIKNDLKRLMEWVDSARLNIIWASDKFIYPFNELQLVDYFNSLQNNNTLAFRVVNYENEQAEIVGHAEIDINGDELKISRLLISKQNRGKGFGEQMMIALIHYIKEKLNYKEICLTVFTFNEPAIALYKKLGFKTTEIDPGFMNFEGEIWDRQKMVLNKA